MSKWEKIGEKVVGMNTEMMTSWRDKTWKGYAYWDKAWKQFIHSTLQEYADGVRKVIGKKVKIEDIAEMRLEPKMAESTWDAAQKQGVLIEKQRQALAKWNKKFGVEEEKK